MKIYLDGYNEGWLEAGVVRALKCLIDQAIEHGWRDGNTFDAGWLSTYGACSRSDVYRLGARCGVHRDEGDEISEVSWTDDDGERTSMIIEYESGSFRCSAVATDLEVG